MKIVVAKMDKRRRETGKDTVVFHNGVQVPAEKIANFKRRKVIRESDPASPGASTPGPITYCTPRIDMDSLIEIDEIAELDEEFSDPEFSAHGSSSQVEVVGLHVPEPKNTNLEVAPNETGLLSVIVSSSPDKNESSSEHVTENQNALANELEEEQERNLLSDFSTQPESVPFQQTEDHAREFVGPGISEVDYPVIDEPNLVTDAPDTPSTELLEEKNLSALSQAIDECFKDGWGLDVTPSQLLSMLTYVQGLDPGTEQPPKWLLSYPELKPIAALAKHFIESREHYAAVLLYKGVIKVATRVLNESEYISSSLSLNYLHMYCPPTYLGHEQAILQIVIASYLKWQLAADIPSEVTSDRILRVINCLRRIRNLKSIPIDEAVDLKLLSLNQLIAWPLGRSVYQFRRELLSHALGLANYCSQKEEFEAAEALFNLRLGTPSTPGNVSYSSEQICKDEQQNYEQHRRRQSSCLYKPRVRPWSIGDLPSLPPNSPSLHKGKIDSLVRGFCQRLIRIRRGKIFQRSKAEGHANRPPLLQEKEAVRSIMVDAETDTDFSNNIRPSELSPGRARRAPLPKRKEGLKVVDLESETDTGFTTSSTRSYRYGVTMSDSDVPGIDLSRYLNK